jgi:hypothetical protein
MLTITSNSETITSNGKIMMTTKHHNMYSSLITMKPSKANHKANNKGSKAKIKATQANNKDHNNYIQT